MATKKATSLPKTIYVYQERDGSETYLCAGYSLDAVADKDETRLVGTYHLAEVGELTVSPAYTRKS